MNRIPGSELEVAIGSEWNGLREGFAEGNPALKLHIGTRQLPILYGQIDFIDRQPMHQEGACAE
jgi:hypothetical protein